MSRLRILITNDDGINAPGLKVLWSALKDYADVYVVAPEVEQSGVGLGITTLRPLNVKKVSWEDNGLAWSVSGTPADCVKVAVSLLLKEPPDLIVSGINNGINPGRTALYSGTVGAIIEGVFRGISGIAFSKARGKDFFSGTYAVYDDVKDYIWPIVEYVSKNPFVPNTILNVNFPHCDGNFKGVKLASQGMGYHFEKFKEEGPSRYRLNCVFRDYDGESPDSDVSLLRQGYITAVPIQVSHLTDKKQLELHKEKFENYQILKTPSFRMV